MHSDPIVRRIHACVLAGVPAYIVSEPGTGKTARVRMYSKITSRHMERWLLSRCEPIDLKPRGQDGKTVFVCEPPEKERLRASVIAGILGLLFLDEINLSTRETEGAALDIVDDPPHGVAIVAAGNPPTRGQAARSLGAAAANRFCHLPVGVDPIAWSKAQVGGWDEGAGSCEAPDSAALARADMRARALFGSYIRKFGSGRKEGDKVVPVLERVPDNPVEAGGPWPSSRSWENARKLYAFATALGYDSEDVRALVSGCVGEGEVIPLLTYIEEADLGDPEDVLAKPKEWKPDPNRVDRNIVLLTAVAGAVEANMTVDRWDAANRIVGRCSDEGQADTAMVYGDMLIAVYKRLGSKDKPLQAKLTSPHVLMFKYAKRLAEILLGTQNQGAP
jgi:hypothetical protein